MIGPGRLVPKLLGWGGAGTNNVFVPNFLAAVFKKHKISPQQVLFHNLHLIVFLKQNITLMDKSGNLKYQCI